jgi:GR25 family glycosyltransferase involved in LPS biosynthesis
MSHRDIVRMADDLNLLNVFIFEDDVEFKEEYIPRCIKYVMDHNEASDDKQAYAICISKWESFSTLPIVELTI